MEIAFLFLYWYLCHSIYFKNKSNKKRSASKISENCFWHNLQNAKISTKINKRKAKGYSCKDWSHKYSADKDANSAKNNVHTNAMYVKWQCVWKWVVLRDFMVIDLGFLFALISNINNYSNKI